MRQSKPKEQQQENEPMEIGSKPAFTAMANRHPADELVNTSIAPQVLRELWNEFEFDPNPQQEEAILHADGPLFLPAGPGSGKTRVLLWRVVNLIVTHHVAPDEIFLSTFTEKAACNSGTDCGP
jgi:hypothetical protein